MRRILLAVFAVAAFGLSAGVASAEVKCNPVCGLVNSQKTNDGKTTAGQNVSQQGAQNSNSGVGSSTGGSTSGGDGGNTVTLF